MHNIYMYTRIYIYIHTHRRICIHVMCMQTASLVFRTPTTPAKILQALCLPLELQNHSSIIHSITDSFSQNNFCRLHPRQMSHTTLEDHTFSHRFILTKPMHAGSTVAILGVLVYSVVKGMFPDKKPTPKTE